MQKIGCNPKVANHIYKATSRILKITFLKSEYFKVLKGYILCLSFVHISSTYTFSQPGVTLQLKREKRFDNGSNLNKNFTNLGEEMIGCPIDFGFVGFFFGFFLDFFFFFFLLSIHFGGPPFCFQSPVFLHLETLVPINLYFSGSAHENKHFCFTKLEFRYS